MTRKIPLARLLISLTVALAAALLIAGSLVACQDDSAPPVDTSQIAATVGDAQILEADVTARINYMRTGSDGELLSDVDWATKLNDAGYTPETLRETVIRNEFALPIMVIQEAAAVGISPDDAEVDARIREQQSQLGAGKTWVSYLNSMGFADEAAYRQLLQAQSVKTPLLAAKEQELAVSDEQLITFVKENADGLSGRRSSYISFPVDENHPMEEARAEAEAVLARLNAGADFAAVADEIEDTRLAESIAAGTATADTKPEHNGGDLGWSSLVYLPTTEYYNTLQELADGQTSGVVESTTAVYIIRCTGIYEVTAESEINTADIPEEIKTELVDYLRSENDNEWLLSLADSDRIVINPMPEGLPYDVDMSLAVTEPDSDGSTPAADLQIIDTVTGTGPEAFSGDLVRVTYTGYLEDGTIFDSSDYHEGYFEFTLGAGHVITGWDQGVVGMQVGGQRRLVIPPDLAYGATGQGSIPGNATLTFDIELLSVNGDTTGSPQAESLSGN